MNDLDLYWLLAFLITALALMWSERNVRYLPPEKWKLADWLIWIIISGIFPLGIMCIIYDNRSNIKNFFCQERKIDLKNNRNLQICITVSIILATVVLVIVCISITSAAILHLLARIKNV